MAKNVDSQVSITGSSYFQPIACLVEQWLKHSKPKTNAVQSGYYEYGFSCSVILLLVAMFESYMVRVRYIHKNNVPEKLKTALNVLFHVYPSEKKKALTDVYVVRDAIFHNHLWAIEYTWGGPQSMSLTGAAKHPAFGDPKFTARVNPTTRKTKALGLSVVPTRVNRTDVKKVFSTLWKTLLLIENNDRSQVYVSHLRVRFKGKPRLFWEVIDDL